MTVWQLSARSLPVILVVVIVRALALHKLPKCTFLALWGLALFALLVPVQLHLTLPAFPLPMGVSIAYDSQSVTNDLVMTGAALARGGGSDVPVATEPELAVIPWTQMIWMLAAGGMAAHMAVNHIRCRLRYRFAVPCKHEAAQAWLRKNAAGLRKVKIKVSADISTALTYGVFRPVILLPRATDWEDTTSLAYVLLHEMTHIRHCDTVWKGCLCAALCVHWFNPLVWVMFLLANRDLELRCDERVIKTIGASCKADYALALIGLAEKRIKITQFGMAFSKNAIEERILAMMKTKKVSWSGAALAVALMMIVTTGFTATWQAAAEEHSPQTGAVCDSRDEGKAWTSMGDEEFIAPLRIPGTQWWTAEEYAQWLEQEKVNLQDCIGDEGWTPTTGWFTWDQQMVDETVERYEQTLKDIQNGLQVSKPTEDGDTMTMFSYDPGLTQSYSDVTTVFGTFIGFDEHGQMQSARIPSHERLEEYKAFGLEYDAEKQLFFWKGALVRYFSDEYASGGGIAVLYSYTNEDGAVDLRAVRQAARGTEGGNDPTGRLVDIAECSQEEFNNRVIMITKTAQEAAGE